MGTCTLRAAIKAARDLAAQSPSLNAHAVNLGVAGTYLLTLGQLTVHGPPNGLILVIANTSGGAVALDGNNASCVPDVAPTAGVTLYVDGVAVQHGRAGSGESGGGLRITGGAFVTLTNTTASGNVAGTNGGGLANIGLLTLTNTTVSGNSAAVGGGLFNEPSPFPRTLQASIVARNRGGNCNAPINSQGDNVRDDSTCFAHDPSGLHDQVVAPSTPLLGTSAATAGSHRPSRCCPAARRSPG